MAKEKAETKQPSLQRLLALDKTFDTLGERLNEAGRLLGLDLSGSSDAILPEKSSQRVSNYGRHEFVLRWILEKLKTQEEARSTTTGWRLACLVVKDMPLASSARVLGSSDIMPTVVKTLGEHFPSTCLDASSQSNATQDAATMATVDSSGSKSKKRKRSDKIVGTEDSGTVNQENQAAAKLDILVGVSNLLRVLVERCKMGDATQSALYQARAIVRIERASVAAYVKHWLYALCYRCLSDAFDKSTGASAMLADLTLMLEVWKLQPAVAISERHSLVELFAKECLFPAVLLLSLIRSSKPMLDPPSQVAKYNAESVRALERFIAQQALLPIKAAFHEQTARKSTSKQPQSKHLDSQEVLAAFQAEYRSLQKQASTSASQRQTLTNAGRGLAYFMDVAVRCANMSTPSRKRSEMAWLDQVFSSLIQPARIIPALSLGTSTGLASSALVEILDVFASRDLSLGRAVLIVLIDSDCNLGSEEAPKFALLSRILRMDANIFAGPKSNHGKQIFDSLTRHAKASSETSADMHIKTEATSIATTLIKAFARARDLQSFLRSWYQCLASSPLGKDNEWYIWTDETLQRSLGDVLETSLTASQIKDQLDTLERAFTKLGQLPSDSWSQSKHEELLNAAFASTVLLNAMLYAINSDALIDELERPCLQISHTIDIMLRHAKGHNANSFVTTYLWPTYSRLLEVYEPIRRINDVNDVNASSSASENHEGIIDLAWNIIHDYWHHSKGKARKAHRQEAEGALNFALLVCNLDRQTPGCDVLGQDLRKLFLSSTTRSLELPQSCDSDSVAAKGPSAVAWAMSHYPQVWALLPPELQKSFYRILFHAIKDNGQHKGAWKALISAIGEWCTSEAKEISFGILYTLLSDSNEAGQTFFADIMLHDWPLASLTRPERERTLDWAVLMLCAHGTSEKDITTQTLHQFLGLAVKLSELPNASSTVATDPNVLWNVAKALNGNNDDTTITFFYELCKLTLGHILDTKEQERSRTFLQGMSEILERRIPASDACDLKLATVFVCLIEAKITNADTEELPHRKPQFVQKWSDRILNIINKDTELQNPGSRLCLLAFASIPKSYWELCGVSGQSHIQQLNKLVDSASSMPMKQRTVSIQQTILFKSGTDRKDLKTLRDAAVDVLESDISALDYYSLKEAFTSALHSSPDADAVTTIDEMLDESPKSSMLALTNLAIASLKGSVLAVDETATKVKTFLPRILRMLHDCRDHRKHVRLTEAVNIILQQKSFLADQSSVESVLGAIYKLVSTRTPDLGHGKSNMVFVEVSTMTRNLLQFHRASLGGRLHLIIPVLQQLLACLFIPHRGSNKTFHHPSWLDARDKPLRVKDAQAFSRLLTLLCNPPQSTISGYRHKSKTPDLVDDVRKARTHVGQHVQYLLHSYCDMQLNGRLGEGVKEALQPGFYAVMDVMDMSAADEMSVKALSASMNNQQRALLRREWDSWKKFGAWRGT